MFRVIAVALPLLALAAIELLLRVSNYGHAPEFFLPRTFQSHKVLTENSRFGRRFFPAHLARTPQPIFLAPRKPAGVTRIFVFGESAAMGDPDPAFGLPRLLQALLDLKFPRHKFEVVNVAMTAINSHVIREIARDCAPLDGDVWIVYAGNNEVIGPFGTGSIFGRPAPRAIVRATIWLKRFRVVQLVASLIPASQDEWKGLEMFARNTVRRDDPKMARVYEHFAKNLTDIVHMGTRADAQVIVSTIAVNLADSPPFASLPGVSLGGLERERWRKEINEGLPQDQEKPPGETHQALVRAADIAGGAEQHTHSELHFHLGRTALALGQFDKARRHYHLAREHDGLRARADERINSIVRGVASGRSEVRFVDAASVLAGRSANGIPGAPLFHDHVHLTFEGNYQLARALLDEVVAAFPAEVRRNGIAGTPTAAECARRLAWTEFNELAILEELHARFQRPPFTSQFGHEARDRALRSRIDALASRLTSERLQELIVVGASAMERHPEDWVLRENVAKMLEAGGDVAGALAQWKEVIRLLPHDAQAYARVAHLLRAMGQEEAARHFQREAERLDPLLRHPGKGVVEKARKGEG